MREALRKEEDPARRNARSRDPAEKEPPRPAEALPEIPILRLQRTLGNQAVLRMLGVQRQEGEPAAKSAEAAGASGVPQEVIEHLKLREGWRDAVYLDSVGLPTAGLGHLLTEEEKKQYQVGDTVPAETLEGWAQADTKKAYDAAVSQAATLGVSDPAFVNALAAVNFQLGTNWNTVHTRTWAYLLAHDWEKAAQEAQASTWYEQTPVRVEDFQVALRALPASAGPAAAPATPAATTAAAPRAYEFKLGPPTGKGTVSADLLNVRRGPGVNYERTGTALQKGAAVTTYGQVEGWYCIGDGQWVSGQFLALGKEAGKPREPEVDLKSIARNVWEAMFGGFGGLGLGTDEEKVYANLGQLNRDKALIRQLKELYQATYGRDLVADIRSEFSDNWFGPELTRALSYLDEGGAPAPKAPAPAAEKPKAASAPAEKASLNEKLSDFIATLKKDPTYGAKVVVTSTLRGPEGDARAVLKNQKANENYYKIFAANWQAAILAAVKNRNLQVDADFEAAVSDLLAWNLKNVQNAGPHVTGRAIDIGLAGGDEGFKSFVKKEAEKQGLLFIDENKEGHYHVQM